MSTVPVPKPRANAQEKRPIPLPRTNIPKNTLPLKISETTESINTIDEKIELDNQKISKQIFNPDKIKLNNEVRNQVTEDKPEVNNQTLTRRISNTSKQIVEDIRHSFSKRNRKSFSLDEHKESRTPPQSPDPIFDKIQFQSPLSTEPSSQRSSFTEDNDLYSNVKSVNRFSSDDDDISLPPPNFAPPPLPDISYYDTPPKSLNSRGPGSRVISVPIEDVGRPPTKSISADNTSRVVVSRSNSVTTDNSSPQKCASREILSQTNVKNEQIRGIRSRPINSSISESDQDEQVKGLPSRSIPIPVDTSTTQKYEVLPDHLIPRLIPSRPCPTPTNESPSIPSRTMISSSYEPTPPSKKVPPRPVVTPTDIHVSQDDVPPPTPTRPSPEALKQFAGIQSIPLEERQVYEAVFPVYPVFLEGSRCSTLDRMDTSRPESWNFYDPVTLNDVTYSNLPSRAGSRISESESSLNSELSQLYENHILELRKRELTSHCPEVPDRPKRPTQSTLLEFDPLACQPSTSSAPSETRILDELFQTDLYGTNIHYIPNYDQCSISEDSENGDEFLNPPTPPTRSDSLVEEKATLSTSEEQSDNKPKNFLSKINEVLKKVPESARNIRAGFHKDKILDRPTLNTLNVNYKGILQRISSKSVEDLFGEVHFRFLILSGNSMVFYGDISCENVKEYITLDSILSVQFVPEKKIKSEEYHCFELCTSSNRSQSGYVFAVMSSQECKLWMQRIAEALTNRFPVNAVMDYKRMGWGYLKEGLVGTWMGAWLVLSRRHLYYAQDNKQMGSIDLRKARCIQLLEPDADNPKTSDMKGPNLIIDCPAGSIYLRMWTARETKRWCLTTQQLAYNNGRQIEEQQLTKDDVPVLVEKCINFIYVNGSMSEGLYRKAGSSTAITDILNQFRKNAWAVSLNSDYTEHDVANALKRFFRDLPEPLLNENRSRYLCQLANTFCENSERAKMYRVALKDFPKITYSTLKKLLGHLYFITTQSEKNKMSSLNLATIWGPTLIHSHGTEMEMKSWITKLLNQLIELYKEIFPLTKEEEHKEELMLEVLERNHKTQGPQKTKASGDLRVWVHLGDKNGETVNITISPQKLAADICIELSNKMNMPAYELQLEELVLNDQLCRPIHYSEKVLDVVLRWGYWDESYRKNNCLVLTTMSKYEMFDKPNGTMIVNDEFKFADNKTKSFKYFIFKFEQAKLCYYKEPKPNNLIKIQEWNIEDILWYFGHEPNHNPQTKWAITFILKKQAPKRTKAMPYFGYTFGSNNVDKRNVWVSTMLRAEYNNGLAPPLIANRKQK